MWADSPAAERLAADLVGSLSTLPLESDRVAVATGGLHPRESGGVEIRVGVPDGGAT